MIDFVLSFMPIRLIRTLHRSTSEKVLIAILMALGLCATAISCAKMTTFPNFGKGDIMQATIMPSLWAKLEEQVGLIATSLPCLKRPVELLLKRTGVLKEHQLSTPSFVVDMSLPGMLIREDERSSCEQFTAKDRVRIDSHAAQGRNSTSNGSTQGRQNEWWHAM